ncbi:RNA polymerase sporulation sigma factor SigH [Bacillus taeanensis]|uniref:RNA polymerase sporulation sigma factor SigH n=2 Tax=Bacillus taeanensis TaxID=273032 RepID=A0A366Y0P5_9BACI|nr:RNA polymerase sporulation sigma factor SigH [Bacillus taeanensis]RBW69974.1 RNA polymerase sporulation sigma factor SigH [Bacillus taeanensis]
MSLNSEVKLVEKNTRLEDSVLIEMCRNGDGESLDYLLNKYQSLVRGKARSYFLIGADKEDIIQEGMIGLYKAIRDFREEKVTSFKSFAELCITRQIITAIKTATRQKHVPLNSSISLDKPINNIDSNATLMDLIPGEKIMNPETLLINQEKAGDMELKIAKLLSDLERGVLALYMDGLSYQEISEELSIPVKSIDNALQRIKRKLNNSWR